VTKPKTTLGLLTRIVENLKQTPAGLPPDYVRAYIMGRFVYLLSFVTHLIFLVMFWFLNLNVLAVFNVLSVTLLFWAGWQHNKANMKWPVVLTTLFEVPIHAILATLYLGFSSAFWMHILISMSIIVLVPFWTKKVRYSICLALSLIMVAIGTMSILIGPLQPISIGVEIYFFASNAIFLALIVVSVIAVYDFAVAQAEEALQLEFSRAESLLLNILPSAIAARLKAQEEPLADSHDSVSVLFADLAGFTHLSVAEDVCGRIGKSVKRFVLTL